MPDWLLALSLPVSGLVGVWLGAWMNQRSAETVAKQTFEGQRILANDAARRDWRRQQVVPFIEAANERARLWNALYLGTLSETRDKPPEQLSGVELQIALDETKRALSLNEQMLDINFISLRLTRHAIPDEAFKAAVVQIMDAEGEFKAGHTTQDVTDVLTRMRTAIDALNRAAEHYIFSAE
jgi:hypothetical protein